MSQIWVIAKRDFRSYFTTPVAYVLTAVFFGIMAFTFYNIVMGLLMASTRAFGPGQMPPLSMAVIQPLFGTMNFFLLMLLPAITMRLFAEEKKLQTLPLLMTAPLGMWTIVLGKFLAAFLLMVVMLGSTSIFFFILSSVTNPDPGVVLSSYLGCLMMASCTIALGVLFSACTESQITAFILTIIGNLMLWIISWAANSSGPIMSEVLNNLSLQFHYQNFLQGQPSSTDLVFYASFIFFSLFMTQRILDSYRWR